ARLIRGRFLPPKRNIIVPTAMLPWPRRARSPLKIKRDADCVAGRRETLSVRSGASKRIFAAVHVRLRRYAPRLRCFAFPVSKSFLAQVAERGTWGDQPDGAMLLGSLWTPCSTKVPLSIMRGVKRLGFKHACTNG